MPDGKTKFEDTRELKVLLAQEREAFLTGLTTALMTYATGRTMGFGDQPEMNRIVQLMLKEDAGLRDLIHQIVLSQPFQTK